MKEKDCGGRRTGKILAQPDVRVFLKNLRLCIPGPMQPFTAAASRSQHQIRRRLSRWERQRNSLLMTAVERIVEAVVRSQKVEFALTDPELAELREGIAFPRGTSTEQVRILPILRDCLREQMLDAEVDVVRRVRDKKQISCISIRDRRRDGKNSIVN